MLATTGVKMSGSEKKVNRNTYNIFPIKRVTRKFLEVSLCSRAKQRQRNIRKKQKKELFLASQKKGVLHVPRFFFFGNQERLPFVWKTRKFRGEFKWNGLSRWKLSGEKNNTFRGITFFPFLPKQPEYSVPFFCITSARLQVERKRKIYLYFVNGTLNPVPVFGAKKYQYHLTDVFHQIPVQKIYILDNYTGAFRKLAKAKINVLNKTRGKS